ncbi:TIGR01244 family sulfur transferase [Sphingomonas sp. LHG3406-1]|uniref:TIGR01244 family sulfur transferase n=1 Tax=Sphingomonas sp. LHG3406-1 TaxID=2804617 RepID=UPI002616E85B|nr:TIGR01244 family sulfur transferase [Sphingomonas sp. LHG3406-1]
MRLAVLTPNVSALAQPSAEDVADLAQRGYRSIIGNRPEGETDGQPLWADLKAAAASHGMEALQIPVVIGQISDDQVAAFRAALEILPKPIAVFCRSGTRSALMWALANHSNLTIDERIGIAAREGYDLEPFRERLARGSAAAEA